MQSTWHSVRLPATSSSNLCLCTQSGCLRGNVSLHVTMWQSQLPYAFAESNLPSTLNSTSGLVLFLRFHPSNVREWEPGLYEEFSEAYGHVSGPFWRAGVGQIKAQAILCRELIRGLLVWATGCKLAGAAKAPAGRGCAGAWPGPRKGDAAGGRAGPRRHPCGCGGGRSVAGSPLARDGTFTSPNQWRTAGRKCHFRRDQR